jgi:hypothetical protein
MGTSVGCGPNTVKRRVTSASRLCVQQYHSRRNPDDPASLDLIPIVGPLVDEFT